MAPFDVMMMVLRFNERINARDLEVLVGMMTEDHFFIDSKGERDDDMEEGGEGVLRELSGLQERVHPGGNF